MTKFKIEVKDSHRIKEKQDTKTEEEKRQEEKMHKKIVDRTLSSRRALKAIDRSNIANLQVPQMAALNAAESTRRAWKAIDQSNIANLQVPRMDALNAIESTRRAWKAIDQSNIANLQVPRMDALNAIEALSPRTDFTKSVAEILKTLDPIGDHLTRMNNAIQDASQVPNLRTLTNEINAFDSLSKLPDYIPVDQMSLENIKKPPYDEMLKSNRKTIAKSEEHNAKMIDAMVEIGNTLNAMHQEQVETNTRLQKHEDTTAKSNNIAKWALCFIVLTLIITFATSVMQFIEIPFADWWGHLGVWMHSSGEWIEESLRNLQTNFTEKTVPPA